MGSRNRRSKDHDPKSRKYPIVLVVWRDAWSEYEIPEQTEFLQDTIGYLVGFDRKVVRVAQTRDDIDTCDVLSVPRECVKEIRRVRIGGKMDLGRIKL